jgi:hypothetical protein
MKIIWSDFASKILLDVFLYHKKVKEGILITDVFDTRQNPIKINDPKRKGSMEKMGGVSL